MYSVFWLSAFTLGVLDTYGLPSLSSTTPLGRLACGVSSSLVGSGIICVDVLRAGGLDKQSPEVL